RVQALADAGEPAVGAQRDCVGAEAARGAHEGFVGGSGIAEPHRGDAGPTLGCDVSGPAKGDRATRMESLRRPLQVHDDVGHQDNPCLRLIASSCFWYSISNAEV